MRESEQNKEPVNGNPRPTWSSRVPTETAGPLHASMVRQIGESDQLWNEWAGLLERCDGDRLFRSPQWARAWLWGFNHQDQVRILVVRDSNETLMGLLPMVEDSHPLLGKRWTLMGSGEAGSDYLDVLVDSTRERDITNAVVHGLLAGSHSWDTLELNNLPADSRFLSLLGHAASTIGARIHWGPARVCPIIDLAGGYQEVLEKGEPAFVRQSQRKRRRLEKEKGFHFGVWTDPDHVREALGHYLALHQKRFGTQSEAVGTTEQARFHRLAMEALSRTGQWRSYWMQLGDEVAAVIWGFEQDGRYYYYQTGFDPSHGNKSVGVVLLLLAVEDCAARGLQEFDLLHGQEPYKFGLATSGRYLDSLQVYGTSPAGRMAFLVRAGRRTIGKLVALIRPRDVLRKLRSIGRNPGER